MKTIQEYLAHAAECDAMAEDAVSADERATILHMAKTWRSLAEQRERMLARTGEKDKE